MSFGTGLLRCCLFLAFFQAAKLAKAHLVHLSVPANSTLFDNAASSTSTNVEKRLPFVVCAKNAGGGAYARGEAYLQETTVCTCVTLFFFPNPRIESSYCCT